ncbi:MAG TPA: hypothetical protein VGN82_23210 [Bosea sp. (in: a-proteobacteria)]|jgi:hypothetical protein|uniref:hypothetical protein n=1 Tax=Bosea sp. (in: a-proteobacteria) TaxID=1871050 RepID=UPI002E0DC17C|nr:hypothetical protein [Bosea sp. (in: a-proteobacteria)]
MGQHRALRTRLDCKSHLFLVGRSQTGFWVARDLEGLSEGIFRDKKAAIRFALFEGGHANAVMLSPDGVEPSFGQGPH